MATTPERVVLGKVTRRLIPFLFVLYIFNFLDRTNVSIAALTMKPDLGFSDAVYGLGLGIFFLGYCLFEVPSNLVLQRIGARVWMARIMITWGIISSCMMFVKSPASFYALRFALGVAEAGFFPGMILYLSAWYPASERAKAVSRFMTAVPLAGVLGNPLSGALLKLSGVAGLTGWQWVFLAEGLPSVVLGIATLFYLTDRPSEAQWLKAEERNWLVERMQREQTVREQHHHFSLWQAFAHPTILLFCLIYFCMLLCGYSVLLWTPLILKSRSIWSNQTISVVGMLPSLCGALAMVLAGAYSDRTGERRWSIARGVWLGAIGLTVSAWTRSPVVTIAGFALASSGMLSMYGPFWAFATSKMSPAATAGAIAFISSVGNLGAFAGPTAMGMLKGATGSFTAGLSVIAGVLLLAGALPLLVHQEPTVKHDAAVSGEVVLGEA